MFFPKLDSIAWDKVAWAGATFLLACVVLAPLFALVYLTLDSAKSFDFLGIFAVFASKETITTLGLMAGVGAATLCLGAGTAWLIAAYEFRGRWLLGFLLVLPFALPSYVSAYAYVELLGYSGPVQETLRDWFGWSRPSDYYFPSITSLGGAIFILALALYPYIYIAALGIFLRPTSSLLRAGRVLGLSECGTFFRLALPLARPTLFAVMMLVWMECMNDIGVVDYLGVRTLTMGLYDTWINRGDLSAALQMALWMMVFAFALIVLERLGRRGQLYTAPPSAGGAGRILNSKQAALVIALCCIPFLLGFVVPMVLLGQMAIEESVSPALDFLRFWTYARHSLALAIGSAVLIVAGGLFLAYASRIGSSRLLTTLTQLSVMGYALPGVLLGLGIILILSQSGSSLFYAFFAGYKILLLGYFVRFIALPYNMITGGLTRIAKQMDFAAHSLGARTSEVFSKVHLPLMRPAIWGALVFVFVEVMRELPLTLVVRSFDFETLATHIYTRASLGQVEEVAFAAVFLGLLGLMPAYLWFRVSRR